MRLGSIIVQFIKDIETAIRNIIPVPNNEEENIEYYDGDQRPGWLYGWFYI